MTKQISVIIKETGDQKVLPALSFEGFNVSQYFIIAKGGYCGDAKEDHNGVWTITEQEYNYWHRILTIKIRLEALKTDFLGAHGYDELNDLLNKDDEHYDLECEILRHIELLEDFNAKTKG